MKIILEERSHYTLRFDPGEDVIEGVAKFCGERDVLAGWFSGLGAAGESILSYYNLDTKQYDDNVFHERLEIASLVGNVARKKDGVVIHAHGVLSGADLKAYSGHVKKLVVSGTCEVLMEVFSEPFTRLRDGQTGLDILQ